MILLFSLNLRSALSLAKQEPIFGSGCKHSVWFLGSLRHQIVDQDADVCFFSSENERIFSFYFLLEALIPAINPWAAASS